MNEALNILSWIFLLSGSAFIVIGALGLVRMPDVFTRVHAAGITDTAGAGLLLAGLMIQGGLTIATFKLFCLLVLFLFTTPVATHALSRAALHAGIMPILKDGEGSAKEIIERGGFSVSRLHDPQSVSREQRKARDTARRQRLNEERRLAASETDDDDETV